MSKQIVQLLALTTLGLHAQEVFGVMKTQKGKSHTVDTLSEKLKALASKDIETAINSLASAGLIVAKKDETEAITGYVLPKSSAEELAAEAANTIGGKAHTSKTSNTDLVLYKGEKVLFQAHTLSPEVKAGQLVQYGILSRTHINEQGFQYFNIKKLNDAGEAAGVCAKKSSGVVLVDAAGKVYANVNDAPVPQNAVPMIGLKKAASDVAKPELVDANSLDLTAKGSAVLVFVAEGSPTSRAMKKVLAKMEADYSSSILIVEADAYWNAKLASQMQVRTVPTLINIKDGNVSDKITGLTSEEDLNKFFTAAVKNQGKAAPLANLPYSVEAVSENAEPTDSAAPESTAPTAA